MTEKSIRFRGAFAVDQTVRGAFAHYFLMKPIIFRCPVTFENVQHLLDDGEDVADQFEAIECPACNKMHINKATGKLLGET
jgi:hypothetical protein